MTAPLRHPSSIAPLLAVPLLAALAGCGQPSPDADRVPSDVILICLDTVRADRLGCYGYERHPTTPTLDRLAEQSTLFRDVTAASGWTKPSVPSYFSGLFPAQHGVYEGSAREKLGATTDVFPGAVATLAEAYEAAGFQTAAFVENAQLKPGGGFEQGFGLYRDEVGNAREIRTAALDWIDDRAPGRPFFLYLHLLDVHWPYPIPDEDAGRFAGELDTSLFRGGDSRALRDAINDGEVVLDEQQLAALDALYDGALRFVDDELGRLLHGLRLRGLDESTVLCVVADHGEEFLEHDRIGHGHGLWENLLAVPWILRVPGRAPAVVEHPVRLVDLPATLLAASGLELGVVTRSVDRLAEPARPAPLFAEHKAPDAYLQSLRVGSSKLIRRFLPPDGPRPGSPRSGEQRVARMLASAERWEAELAVEADGSLRALQLKPRDEPGDDPIELKGAIEQLDGSRFAIAGVPVELRPDVLWSGDLPAGEADLREGQPVKVRGDLADGSLLAERIKTYAEDEPAEPELRGPVSELQAEGPGGRLRLGPLWIAYDESTTWKDVDEPDARLSREQIVELLQGGAERAARDGWRIEQSLYDLRRDPGELRPVATWAGPPGEGADAELTRLSELLDELGAELIDLRLWSRGDRLLLSEEDTEALRAIGYVR